MTLVYCGQTAEWIKIPLGRDVDLSPGHIVLDGDPAPPPQKKNGGTAPQFSAHVCCGQTAGWSKRPLGTEIVLGPGHIVLVPSQLPLKRGTSSPFSAHVYCRQTAGWIRNQDTTWYGGTFRPMWRCGRWGPRCPHGKGTAVPTFRPTLLWHGRPSQLLLSTCCQLL